MSVQRVGEGCGKTEQRRRALETIDRQLKEIQGIGRVGKVTIELEVKRGGTLNTDCWIEYTGTYRFLESIGEQRNGA